MSQSLFLPTVGTLGATERGTIAEKPPEPTWGAAISAAVDDKHIRMAAWIDNLFTGSNAYDREATTKGWNYADHWEQAEKGLSWHNVEYLRENAVGGPMAMARATAEAQRREEMDRYWAQAGIGKAIVGNLVAEAMDPTAWAVGFGATMALSRTVLGVGRLLAAGRPGAAIGAAAVEAAVGEVAFTGLQDWTGEVVGVGDYLTAAAAGAVIGGGLQGLTSRGAFRRAAEVRAREEAERIAQTANPQEVLDPRTGDQAKVKDVQDVVADTARKVGDDNAVMPADLIDEIRKDFDGKVDEAPAPKPTTAPKPAEPEVGPATPPPEPKPTTAPKPEPVDVGGEKIPVADVDETALTPDRVLAVVKELDDIGQSGEAIRLLDDYLATTEADVGDLVDLLAYGKAVRDRVPASQRDAGETALAIGENGRIRAVQSGETVVVLQHSRKSASGKVGDVATLDKAAVSAAKAAATKAGGGWAEIPAAKALRAALDSNPHFARLRPVIERLLAQEDSLKSMRVVLVGQRRRGFATETGAAVSPATDDLGGSVLSAGDDPAGVFAQMGKWSSETMVHELIHTATQHILRMSEVSYTRAKLSPPVLEAIETVEDVVLRLNQRIAEDANAPSNVKYAATNAHELLAMALSDADVMRYLAQMPASKKWGGGFSNTFSELINAIKAMIGLDRNAATDVVDAFDTLFRAYDTVAIEYATGGNGAGWPGRSVVQGPPAAPTSLYETSRPLWDSAAWRAGRNLRVINNPADDKLVSEVTFRRWRTVKDLLEVPPGVTLLGKFRRDPDWQGLGKQLQTLAERWLPDQTVIFSDTLDTTKGPSVQGQVLTVRNTHLIGLRDDLAPQKALRTAVHEVGHAVFHRYAREIPAEVLADMRASFNDYVQEVFNNDPNAVNRRFSVTSLNREKLAGKAIKSNEYALNFDEYSAEQFVKYIEKRARSRGAKEAGLTAQAAKAVRDLFDQMVAFFKGTVNERSLDPDASFETFFDGVLQRAERDVGARAVEMAASAPVGAVNPVATIGTRRAFADRMYDHARDFVARRPINLQRLRTITAKIGGLSDGLVLARSNNPILQMISSLVTETTTGAAGRGPTAAIRKEMLRTKLTGNALLDYEAAYAAWKAPRRVGLWNDVVKGDARIRFNREVYLEVLNRRAGDTLTQDAAVRRAADSLEGLFSRALKAQKDASVLGADRLPADSVGYLPQALDGRKLANATADEIAEFRDYLSARFQNVLGWSSKFSKEFAEFYVMRANARAKNANAKDYAAAATDSLSVIRESLEEMRTQARDPNIRREAETSIRGMGQTKRRLDIDLRDTLPSGKMVLDFYEDDPMWLARRYVNRTSGVLALTEFGIPGDIGVRQLADVLDFPTNPMERVTQDEREAFERVMAEMLGTPVPGEVRMRHLTAMRLLVNLQRLGGLVWTQTAEMVNMVHHLGLAHTLRGVSSLPRMFGEVGRVKRGANPNNHVLTHIEQWGGEFGANVYKMQMPLDPPDNRLTDYANDSTLFERLVRAGSFAQAKVSGFRALMSAQHRMVAEQVTMKMARYAREGASADKWLADMGISDEVLGHLRLHLNRVARWDSSGRLVQFDITQLPDPRVAEAVVQAVHRGVFQIIQGTFVGETGAWAHNDYLKFLLKLRTFGLTASEKQWSRAVGVLGGNASAYTKAGFLLMAQVALVMPIIAARVHLASIGREDRDEYIQKQLDPVNLVRAAMNYTSMSGLLGDALDAIGAVAGGFSDDAGEFLGGRQGTGQGRVSDVVPGLGTVDAAVNVATGNATVYKALKQLPFSNLPYVVPIINLFKE